MGRIGRGCARVDSFQDKFEGERGMKMNRAFASIFVALLMTAFPTYSAHGQGIPLPFRIGGTVVIDGIQLTQDTDAGLLIKITKPDGTEYSDANGNHPDDNDGLSDSNWYLVNIPTYNADIQPGGAGASAKAVIHIFIGGIEYQVTSPARGEILVGNTGTKMQVDIVAESSTACAITVTYPIGGETLLTGATHTIAWTYAGHTGPSVKIQLLTGNLIKAEIASSAPIGSGGSGFHDWTIPADQTTGFGFKIRITSTTESSCKDSSNATFTIKKPSTPKPNLAPVKPAGWSNPVVVSKVVGTHTDSTPLYDNANLYIDWAVKNKGPGAATAAFTTTLYIDGVVRGTWSQDPPLAPASSHIQEDHPIGKLSAGTHTVSFVVDSGNNIVEGSETDNEYTRTINVLQSTPKPNLTPFQPIDWSDKIVVSNKTGTNTDDAPLHKTDTLYVDWAAVNNGTKAVEVLFYSVLYVDGAAVQSWYTPAPLNFDYYVYVSDFPIGLLSVGAHTINLVTDSTGVVGELNETDNEYTKTIWVQN
jgi:hypothetical protein